MQPLMYPLLLFLRMPFQAIEKSSDCISSPMVKDLLACPFICLLSKLLVLFPLEQPYKVQRLRKLWNVRNCDFAHNPTNLPKIPSMYTTTYRFIIYIQKFGSRQTQNQFWSKLKNFPIIPFQLVYQHDFLVHVRVQLQPVNLKL